MGVYTLFLFIVGCTGIQWKAMNDFKKSFEGYSRASINTITHLQNTLDASRTDTELFFNNSYSNNPTIKRIRISNDKCSEKLIDENYLKFLFENQVFQLQIPLRRRLVEIRDKLNKLNSSIEIYERVASSIFQSCKSLHGNCLKETNEWLSSTIYSLSCTIQPNCQIVSNHTNHFIRKRTICPIRQFRCEYGKCISGNSFCDGECDCTDCSDEPDECVKECPRFRCTENFRCIPYNKMCDGNDDCGDGTDEEECATDRHSRNEPMFRRDDCSIDLGRFFCRNSKCIDLRNVCDGKNDCGDWSDEGIYCRGGQCPPECSKKGGVCSTGSKGPECVYECPYGTYETSRGCSHTPDPPFTTLVQFLEDTPRLTTRYGGRVKFLKNKTVRAISKSLEEVVKCKKKTKSNVKSVTVIDEENMPGKVKSDSGSDETNSKNRPKNTENPKIYPSYQQILDDENMAGRLSSESGNEKVLPDYTPMHTKKPDYHVFQAENLPGAVSESKNSEREETSRPKNPETVNTEKKKEEIVQSTPTAETGNANRPQNSNKPGNKENRDDDSFPGISSDVSGKDTSRTQNSKRPGDEEDGKDDTFPGRPGDVSGKDTSRPQNSKRPGDEEDGKDDTFPGRQSNVSGKDTSRPQNSKRPGDEEDGKDDTFPGRPSEVSGKDTSRTQNSKRPGDEEDGKDDTFPGRPSDVSGKDTSRPQNAKRPWDEEDGKDDTFPGRPIDVSGKDTSRPQNSKRPGDEEDEKDDTFHGRPSYVSGKDTSIPQNLNKPANKEIENYDNIPGRRTDDSGNEKNRPHNSKSGGSENHESSPKPPYKVHDGIENDENKPLFLSIPYEYGKDKNRPVDSKKPGNEDYEENGDDDNITGRPGGDFEKSKIRPTHPKRPPNNVPQDFEYDGNKPGRPSDSGKDKNRPDNTYKPSNSATEENDNYEYKPWSESQYDEYKAKKISTKQSSITTPKPTPNNNTVTRGMRETGNSKKPRRKCRLRVRTKVL